MTNGEILRRIFSNFIKNTGKFKFIFMIFFGALYSFIAYLEPVFFSQIIKTIELFLQTGNFQINEFIKLMSFWGAFIVVSTTMAVVYRYFFVEKTNLNNFITLTSKYSESIINMDYPMYLSKEVGKIYKRFNRGLEMQFNFFMFFLGDFIKSFFGIIFVIAVLFYINAKMALITLILLPVMIILGIIFFKKLFPTQKLLDDKWDSIYSDLGNIMSVFSLVKTLRLEKLFSKKIENKLNFCYNKQLKVSKGWAVADIYTALFTTISRFFVLGAGVFFLLKGEITFATLFLFFSYIGWIYFPLGFLFARLHAVQTWISAAGIFYTEFDNLENEYKNSKGKKIKKVQGEIKFNNVSFAYGKKEVIKNMTFKVEPGEKIAFVGDTGAGKSTIVNLFLRFWSVDSGQINLDDYNISDLDLKDFRNHIGLVSQDNSLFNLSIKENLSFANKKATNKDLEKAIKNAEANFVYDFDDGIDSIIGERGLKLSGGEKQRLSIARLFLKNPKILILDEATSALDNKTEKLIQKALDKLMKGRTSIVIAHRLSTIKNVDRIFVLKKGKIVETGNYNKLIKQKGEFYKLVNPDSLIIK